MTAVDWPWWEQGDPLDCAVDHVHLWDGSTSDGLDCHPPSTPDVPPDAMASDRTGVR